MRKPITREKLLAEINITPFTDVVLVLLIIFMITTPMLLQPGIKVRLPEASRGESETEKNITIFIDKHGRVFMDNRGIGLEALKSRLTARLAENADMPVIVKGDKEVAYESVIEVIDAAKQSGAKKFALAIELSKNLKQGKGKR